MLVRAFLIVPRPEIQWQQRVFKPLVQRLGEDGIEVGEATHGPSDTDGLLDEYELFSPRSNSVDSSRVILIGFQEAADWIVESYYSIASRNPPLAIILLAPSSEVSTWIQVSVPFLALGDDFERVRAAVHHHQSRYGDTTRLIRRPHLEADLVREAISSWEVHQIFHWLKRTLKAPRRPKETLDGRLISRAAS